MLEILKSQVKDVLGIEEELEIERAHRVGQKREFFTRRDGSKVKAHPRPIVAKFKSWKQREKSSKLQNRFALLMSNFWKTLVKEHWTKELQKCQS